MGRRLAFKGGSGLTGVMVNLWVNMVKAFT
jgi:hypothetical protein